MNVSERLQEAIDLQLIRLRASVPVGRDQAILAIIRVGDRRPRLTGFEAIPDLVTGRHIADLGGNLALRFCLEAPDDAVDVDSVRSGEVMDEWAGRFVDACGSLAEAELVLGHCETGFMRALEKGNDKFAVWVATKRVPTSWRERADIDWWGALLARRYGVSPPFLTTANRISALGYQLGYPEGAVIGGCTISTYRAVLEQLIRWAIQERDRGVVANPRSEQDLIDDIAKTLSIDPISAERAVDAYIVDRERAGYHAAVPGVAAAPLIRIGPDRIAWSFQGLTTEPLLFLARELRRRDAQAYHNTAHLREGVFRQDLYALFEDKRFVKSAARIELRREAGDVRTDVDAVVFDKKSGTLGIFELKSQDPFARSAAELMRQRDNVLYANRQISGVLDWLKRHGGDALLGRVDARTAKTFRVQKVVPFVLGRYLVHFNDGAEPDRRAAWGTWPQLLRLLDGQPVRALDANPLLSLHTRLSKDVSPLLSRDDLPARRIDLGDTSLVVYPSYAAYQSAARLFGV